MTEMHKPRRTNHHAKGGGCHNGAVGECKASLKTSSQNQRFAKRKLAYLFGPKEYWTAAQIEAKMQIINC